jgi:succinylglutamic semialdehyde dehydrogenase
MPVSAPVAGRLSVAGDWVAGEGGPMESRDPFSGGLVWRGRAASPAQVDRAVAAAAAAAPGWRAIGFAARRDGLQRYVEVVRERREDLADTIAKDAGKPLWDARLEVDALIGKPAHSLAAHELRNAERVTRLDAVASVTRFRPHGAVVVLGPYNFPASMASNHMVPALLAGDTVVLKPSEQTPLVAQRVVECWVEAGLPDGVVNLVQGGPDVGQALVAHEGVRGVFFTGGTRAGLAIRAAAQARAREPILALEMAGNSPFVVWDYDDSRAAVLATLQSAFISAGQRCSAARRLILPEADAELLPALREAAAALVVGDPRGEPQPFCGPVIAPTAADAIMSEQDRLLALGARPLLRCTRPPSGGRALVTPGIIDVTGVDGVGDEEAFGPLLKVWRAGSLDEALALAADTRFGLAAGIVTRSRAIYEAFYEAVPAGIVNWNRPLPGASPLAPFGGIGLSGNHRPTGFLAADYVVFASASLESPELAAPDPLPPGVSL